MINIPIWFFVVLLLFGIPAVIVVLFLLGAVIFMAIANAYENRQLKKERNE